MPRTVMANEAGRLIFITFLVASKKLRRCQMSSSEKKLRSLENYELQSIRIRSAVFFELLYNSIIWIQEIY